MTQVANMRLTRHLADGIRIAILPNTPWCKDLNFGTTGNAA